VHFCSFSIFHFFAANFFPYKRLQKFSPGVPKTKCPKALLSNSLHSFPRPDSPDTSGLAALGILLSVFTLSGLRHHPQATTCSGLRE
jgi:hypothetical protein